MSRAFVKESDQDLSSLPELEISPHPNFVTASGHDALVRRVRELEAERTAARSAGDEARLARVARDLRFFLVGATQLPNAERKHGCDREADDDGGNDG